MRAAIDIGSNTVRAVVGVVEAGQVKPKAYYRQITRLGGGFCKERGLHTDAIDRTLNALKSIQGQLNDHSVNHCRVVATEAMRRASNAPVLIDQVKQATGLTIEIIPGDEEARLSSAGILAALDPIPDLCLFFDLGGGSTEIGLVRKGRLDFFRSYPLGVVRQAEEYPDQTARVSQVRRIFNQVKNDIQQQFGLLPSNITCVGTAGTVTTLAALDLQMVKYDWRRINNHRLSSDKVRAWRSNLDNLSTAQRCALPGMEEGRADLIVPGCEVIETALDLCHSSELIVSDFGLLEGILLDLSTQN